MYFCVTLHLATLHEFLFENGPQHYLTIYKFINLLTYDYRISQTVFICKRRKDLPSSRSSIASYLAIASHEFQIYD